MIHDRGPRCRLYPDGFQCWKQAGHSDPCESYEQQLGLRRNPSTGEATVPSVPSADGSTGNRAGAPGRDDAPAAGEAAIPAEPAATTTIPVAPDTPEWLDVRARYAVNASSAAALFGESPWETLRDVAAQKLGIVKADPWDRTPATEAGHAVEPALIDWLSHRYQMPFEKPQCVYARGHIAASLDGRHADPSTRIGAEAKWTSRTIHRIPRHWWWQAQAQMYAADLLLIVFGVLDANGFESHEVRIDERAQAALHDAAETFAAYLDMGMLPDPVPPPLPDTAVPVDAQLWAEWLAAKADADRSKKRLDDARKALEESVADAMATWTPGTKAGAVIEGQVVGTWRVDKPSRHVPAAALRKHAPDLFDQLAEEGDPRLVLTPTKESA